MVGTEPVVLKRRNVGFATGMSGLESVCVRRMLCGLEKSSRDSSVLPNADSGLQLDKLPLWEALPSLPSSVQVLEVGGITSEEGFDSCVDSLGIRCLRDLSLDSLVFLVEHAFGLAKLLLFPRALGLPESLFLPAAPVGSRLLLRFPRALGLPE